MLDEIMASINNYFERETHTDEWTVSNGAIDLPFLEAGQYYRIKGSIFNDGVHQRGAEDLRDETFDGDITALAPPRAFIELTNEIIAWERENGAKVASPYQSESFGGYSYTKPADASWASTFSKRLRTWRKI